MNESNNQKLGRGLSALIGESKIKNNSLPQGNNQKVVELIDVEKIVAGIYQPRVNFDENELQELAESIKANGLIQPIILRKSEDNKYEIIAGERRFRATKIAGIKQIPAIIKKINNHEALEMAIIENIQRSDLSLIEEASGYQKLISEFSYSQEQIAQQVGKSRSHIANLLRLLSLPQSVRDLLDKKLISMGHARAIINSTNPEFLSQKILSESLTVRDTENLVRDERIEKVKNIPVLVQTESKIRFVNSAHLVELENQFSEILEMETKISYNSFKDNGKIIIKFNDFTKIQNLLKNLKKVSHEKK